jgi:hypothetical protein
MARASEKKKLDQATMAYAGGSDTMKDNGMMKGF